MTLERASFFLVYIHPAEAKSLYIENFIGFVNSSKSSTSCFIWNKLSCHRRCGGLLTTIQIDIFHVLAEHRFPDIMTDYIA